MIVTKNKQYIPKIMFMAAITSSWNRQDWKIGAWLFTIESDAVYKQVYIKKEVKVVLDVKFCCKQSSNYMCFLLRICLCLSRVHLKLSFVLLISWNLWKLKGLIVYTDLHSFLIQDPFEIHREPWCTTCITIAESSTTC